MKKVYLFLFALMASICAVNAQYKVGDIYDKDGVKGMVIQITDGGAHGLLMSLETSGAKWYKDKDDKFSTAAFYEDDGMKNMNALATYIRENGKSWSDFPVFEWARSLGDGWYIPAKDEIIIFRNFINGGDTEKVNEKNIKAINKVLKKAKGKEIKDKMLFTSTETDNGMVNVMIYVKGLTPFAKTKTQIVPQYKANGSFIMDSRAVHKF